VRRVVFLERVDPQWTQWTKWTKWTQTQFARWASPVPVHSVHQVHAVHLSRKDSPSITIMITIARIPIFP